MIELARGKSNNIVQALTACPRCSAQPGERCVTVLESGGFQWVVPHVERRHAAEYLISEATEAARIVRGGA